MRWFRKTQPPPPEEPAVSAGQHVARDDFITGFYGYNPFQRVARMRRLADELQQLANEEEANILLLIKAGQLP